MTTKTFTIAPHGLDALLITVEVSISTTMPSFQIVGLPDKAVNEAKERVRAAMLACGITLPAKKILINLAPADLPKEGGRYDLPIAIALLAALGAIPAEKVKNLVSVGELRLDSTIDSGYGILPAALTAHQNDYQFLCSSDAAYELKDVKTSAPLLADTLIQALQILNDKQPSKKISDFSSSQNGKLKKSSLQNFDMKDIKGQETAKHALEIAASGGHNLLLSGPPGTGKSMLASCLPDILPPPTADEMFDIALIASVTGEYHQTDLTKRPYRAPHHSASSAALIGGGRKAQAGDITRSHCGVLFLDELPEFKTDTLDALRQPLETGDIVISRAERHVTYPACFQLIAAMNPCKCGYLGEEKRECHKAPHCGTQYTSRISGPLLDRFDLRLQLSPVSLHDLTLPATGETSQTIQNRVIKAKNIQIARYEKYKSLNGAHISNAHIKGRFFEQVCQTSEDAKALLHKAVERFGLSVRGYHRILRTARTLQDMQDSQEFSLDDQYDFLSLISIHNIATAINFRH